MWDWLENTSGGKPEPLQSAASIWEQLGDYASGAWNGVTQTVSDSIDYVTSIPQRAKESIKEEIGDVVDGVEGVAWNGVLMVAVLLGVAGAVIYFAGKSGAIGQAAGFMKP